MTAQRLQILVVVDVEGSVTAGELADLLPHERDERKIFSLVGDGEAPRVVRHGPEAQPVDWAGLGRAVERVAALVREASAGQVLRLYVGGQGPLPVFAHLGYALSKFGGEQWIVGRRPGEAWKLFPLAGDGGGPSRLEAGEPPRVRSSASGQLAIYVDTAARPMDEDALRAAVERAGDRLADAVELRPEADVTVDPENAAGLAMELVAKLSRIPALYPHRSSLGLFVAGPTFLGYAAGRAINPTFVGTVMLYNKTPGPYEPVYGLPFDDPERRPLPADEDSVADRARVKAVLRAAIEELQAETTEDDLAAPLLEHEWGPFLDRLARLAYADSDRVEFSLSVAHGSFSFGEGLVEAVRGGEPEQQRRFAKLLLLHELFHEHQGIRSTNYYDVGRAGVVLEAIDFTADVFALRVATRGAFRRLGEPAPAPGAVRAEIAAWLDAVLYGIRAFDVLEHGARIGQLADRRLRRYLTWHLQQVRGETVDTVEDVAALLGAPVTAELAPVSARIDRRHDRLVLDATPATELFAAVGGRLIRHARRPRFEPGALIEAVRVHDTAAIREAMRFVIGENRAALVPWRR